MEPTAPILPMTNRDIPSTDLSSTTKKATGWRDPEGWLMKTAAIVWKVVKWIFIVAVGVGLFIANSTFFAIGFIAGIILPEHIRSALYRIKAVWDTQPWVVVIVVGAGAFLALPITLAASSLLYGAAIGCYLSEKAREKLAKSRQANETRNQADGLVTV